MNKFPTMKINYLNHQKILIRIYRSSSLTFISILFLLSFLIFVLSFLMYTWFFFRFISRYKVCELLLCHYLFFLLFFFFFFLPVCCASKVGFFLLYCDTNIVGASLLILFLY
uniref:Uncharacterized protein n=1 Tax=uncultured marine virus TaxID=186617 RepID=A0A0F7L183_9VIRU|nr:hypothetical protein [uncultured marine virus]